MRIMPLPFNKKLDIKLLRLVKEHSVLYNPNNERYVNFEAREVVWHKIGDTLNRPPQLCKARWVNIRDMMRRKIRERLKNPNQHSYNYKYEDELGFMIPYFKESISAETIGTADYSEFTEEQSTSNNDDGPTQVYLELSEYESDEDDVKPNIQQIKKRSQTQEEVKENDRSVDRTTDRTTDRTIDRTIDRTTDRTIDMSRSHDMTPKDPLDVFLITIGTTLRKFSPYYLNQAKSKIFQVVQDYELEQIVNKDDQPSNSEGTR